MQEQNLNCSFAFIAVPTVAVNSTCMEHCKEHYLAGIKENIEYHLKNGSSMVATDLAKTNPSRPAAIWKKPASTSKHRTLQRSISHFPGHSKAEQSFGDPQKDSDLLSGTKYHLKNGSSMAARDSRDGRADPPRPAEQYHEGNRG